MSPCVSDIVKLSNTLIITTGVFTTLIRKLGVRGLEVTELYSVEPFATDHLNPYGLVFCYLCDEDIKARDEFGADDEELDDPDARDVWFANQLSDDACASQAILNVLLNCRGVDLGPALREFAADTERMSPVVSGLYLVPGDTETLMQFCGDR